MEELLALARDCTVTVSLDDSGQYRFEARKHVGDKEYGIACIVSVEEVANAKLCVATRRLNEMRAVMGGASPFNRTEKLLSFAEYEQAYYAS